ncbi:porin [Vibrio sp. TH_r3]|uniref:porin n=1 Tax=Vibrio sp. TH_r3 TaxID=3082084 RepID=UPI0029559DD8|nr:porin [Vibrio sp. TH_r3]MDV7103784.1 porin [Vibrio sp. TH_r3]
MKKTLLAFAIATITTGANAANIYSDDQNSLDLKGEIDAYLSTSELKNASIGNYKNDPDVDVWAKIQVDATHKLNDSVTVFGSFEIENGVGFGFDSSEDKDVTTDDEYIGATLGENFGFAVGEIGDFGDSLDAIIIDNTNEGVGYVDDVAGRFESKSHGISFKYDTDNLTLIADTYLSAEQNQDAVYGLSASYDIAGFNIGASYQDRGNRGTYDTTNTGDNDVYGIKLGYSFSDFSIASHYVVEQVNSVDYEVVGVAADYTIEDVRLYTSAYVADADGSSDEITTYTLGADYAFSENLLGFVEYSAADNNDYEDNAEYSQSVAGVYFTF